jgi:hypothetical protein
MKKLSAILAATVLFAGISFASPVKQDKKDTKKTEKKDKKTKKTDKKDDKKAAAPAK